MIVRKKIPEFIVPDLTGFEVTSREISILIALVTCYSLGLMLPHAGVRVLLVNVPISE